MTNKQVSTIDQQSTGTTINNAYEKIEVMINQIILLDKVQQSSKCSKCPGVQTQEQDHPWL